MDKYAQVQPFDERECEHCKGLICVRMPVPSSGCDHLYYPDCCKICKEREEIKNPSELYLLKKQLDQHKETIRELVKALSQHCEDSICKRETHRNLLAKVKKLEKQ